MPQAQPTAPSFTPAERRGLERLVARGFLASMPEPARVRIPVLPSLQGSSAELLDELRDER